MYGSVPFGLSLFNALFQLVYLCTPIVYRLRSVELDSATHGEPKKIQVAHLFLHLELDADHHVDEHVIPVLEKQVIDGAPQRITFNRYFKSKASGITDQPCWLSQHQTLHSSSLSPQLTWSLSHTAHPAAGHAGTRFRQWSVRMRMWRGGEVRCFTGVLW